MIILTRNYVKRLLGSYLFTLIGNKNRRLWSIG